MAAVQGTEQAFHWSVNKLAKGLGADRRTVTRRIEEAGIQPVGSQSGHPVYSLDDVARALHSKEGTFTGPQDLDQFPEARKAWFQSENERLKFEQTIGQLIPETEHSRTLAAVMKAVAAGLDSLPDVLEREVNLDAAALVTVTEVLDGARAAMAEAARKAVKSDR